MNDPHIQLRDYLKRLVFNFIYQNSILRQVNLYYDFIDKNGIESVKVSSHFYRTVLYSFKRILTIESYKLLSKREDRSLVDWLQKAYEHAENLEPTRLVGFDDDVEVLNKEEYRKEIDRDWEELDVHETIIDNLKSLRDEGFAHSDKAYFENPEKLDVDYSVSWKEFNNLFGTITSILRKHHSLLFDSDMSMELVTPGNIDISLKHTRAFIRVFNNDKLRELDLKLFSFMRDDYDPNDIFL